MCRIFGLLDAKLSAVEMAKRGLHLAESLRHGGPDGCAQEVLDGVLLGGTRLAISDPDKGSQPFRSDGVTVFYNGEIYNASALRQQLRSEGVRFRTSCDGEVIAPLIARYGSGAAEYIDGMYAIAAFDRLSGRLLLLRDPAGIKPLYVFADGHRVGFASEIPALVWLRNQSVRVDVEAVDRYLRYRAVYGAQPVAGGLGDPTMVEGIFSLPPGHCLNASASRRPGLTATVRPGMSMGLSGGSVARLMTRLPAAVAEMRPTDVPFCTVLSGGLDSTIVTTLAAEDLTGLRAFTVVPRHPSRYDESPYAALAAKAAGVQLTRVPVGGAEVPELLPAVVRHLGQPNSDPITVSTYRLFEAIREAGFKVAFTGDGSDEIFGGYDRFRALARTGDREAYRDALCAVPVAWLRALYTADARATLRSQSRAEDGPWHGSPDPNEAATDVTQFELRHRLPTYHLTRLDHLSAAHGVEARVPFCRRDIALLGYSLALSEKVGDGSGTKVSLTTAAMRLGWAPAAIASRPKQPFTFNLVENLLDDGAIALKFAKEVLTDPGGHLSDVFNMTVVEKAMSEVEANHDEKAAHVVWALLVWELWRRQLEDPR